MDPSLVVIEQAMICRETPQARPRAMKVESKLELLKTRIQKSILTMLGFDENVGNVLVFTEKRQVKQNFNWLGICRHDNQLGKISIQRLGS